MPRWRKYGMRVELSLDLRQTGEIGAPIGLRMVVKPRVREVLVAAAATQQSAQRVVQVALPFQAVGRVVALLPAEDRVNQPARRAVHERGGIGPDRVDVTAGQKEGQPSLRRRARQGARQLQYRVDDRVRQFLGE